MGKAGKAAASMPSYIRREASLFPLFSFSLPERALFAPTGHLPHLEEKANGRSFEPTCASNECAFEESWRDVPYKYAALRVLTQCTTSLKAGMSDRAPLCFPHLSFIRLEPYLARFARHLPHAGNALMREDGVLVSLSSPWGRRYSHFPPLRRISPLSFISPVPSPPLRASSRGADDTREICHRRPSGIARFILRRCRHHNLEPIIFSLSSKKEPAFAGSFCISTIYFLLKA